MGNTLKNIVYEGIFSQISHLLYLVGDLLAGFAAWSQVFALKLANEPYLSKEPLWAVLSASDHPQTFSGDFYDVFDSSERR